MMETRTGWMSASVSGWFEWRTGMIRLFSIKVAVKLNMEI